MRDEEKTTMVLIVIATVIVARRESAALQPAECLSNRVCSGGICLGGHISRSNNTSVVGDRIGSCRKWRCLAFKGIYEAMTDGGKPDSTRNLVTSLTEDVKTLNKDSRSHPKKTLVINTNRRSP